ncbi:MAG: outer membrane beta-barrel protein [Allorhizobium sp.]
MKSRSKTEAKVRGAQRLHGRALSLTVCALLASTAPLLGQQLLPATNPSQTAQYGAVSDPTAAGTQPVDDTTLPTDPAIDAPVTDDYGRMNTRQGNIDDTRGRVPDSGAPGVRLGTLLLRPSISERIVSESTKSGTQTDRRTYSETGLKGTLTTDWSRHELKVTGEGRWQKNISGTAETEPTANIAADLRLDLADQTVAHVTAGYDFGRESTSDPNAINGAAVQSGIDQYTAGLSVEHDFGLLRGTAGLDATRYNYSDATLSDGTQISLTDRNRTSLALRTRLGYELSPALIPFIELSAGRIAYDEKTDKLGYARSADTYGAKAGIAADFGDKFKGELGLGYKQQRYEDQRLAALEAWGVDGNIGWSPERGTDLNLGFTTTLEPSTTAGLSGTVAYGLTADLTRQLSDNLVGSLKNSATWRRYPSENSASDNVRYESTVGLAVDINRYFALTADLGYELTDNKNADDTRVLRAGVGITARR